MMVIDFISCKQQTADMKSQHLGKTKPPTVKFQKPLCVSYLLPRHSQFSLFLESTATDIVCSWLRGTGKQQPTLTSWLAVSMYVSGIQSDLIPELPSVVLPILPDECLYSGTRSTKTWLTWMWILVPRQWLVAALVAFFI